MKEIEEFLLHSPAHEQWKEVGVRHHHGIAIPLFSLHSEKSAGIGEFLDLLPLIKWCHEIGLDVIQLLPLNDTGLGTSPYSAISAFALSPLYLSLDALPGIERVSHYKEKIGKIRYWNKTSRVKYHIVRELKLNILQEYFRIQFPHVSHTTDYLQFIEENPWLKPYSLFRAIKEIEYWKEWEEWAEELRSPSRGRINSFYEANKEQCDFYIFLQYYCYKQMHEVKEYGTKHHVMIKGDLPILIGRDSADVWAHPEMFQLEYGAGAPPDYYAKEGQSWGFPLYNWERLAEQDYGWWKERLRLASKLYHLYRIDHVVGFYRIWAIPLGKSAVDGCYIPDVEDEQRSLGERLMKMMLDSASALPIGEDLGAVPPWVKESLHHLGICGTKMMRWERYWHQEHQPYIHPSDYPALTMTTVSTHDSDTLTLWWRHSPHEARLYCEYKGWDYKPFLSKERIISILYDSHHSNSLFHINLLPEYLALFPELVSDNPNDERINIPGKVLERNWTYRLHVNLETIIEHRGLKELFTQLLPD